MNPLAVAFDEHRTRAAFTPREELMHASDAMEGGRVLLENRAPRVE